MINLIELASKQKQLDDYIIKNRGLEGQDLLLNTIFALQVEVGECANEWRGFKFWSIDQEPRTKVEHLCPICSGTGKEKLDEYFSCMCEECDGSGKLAESNPLLEEYVDCLHFFLSIGNQFGVDWNGISEASVAEKGQVDIKFALIMRWLSHSWWNYHDAKDNAGLNWWHALGHFLGLGKLLGFTDEQITEAYLNKHQVNYERQQNGY